MSQKISDMTVATSLAAADIFPIVQGGANKSSAMSLLLTYISQNLGDAGADIASATTTDIGAATGLSVKVTGTTTITGLGTKTAGCLRFVTFSGALILTHHATSLILPTGANITTAAGDTAIFQSLGSGNWKCLNYTRVNGTALSNRRSMDGLSLIYSSASVIDVNAGMCLDKNYAALISLTARTSVTVTSNGAISGNDSFAGSGTASTNTANATVTGSSSAFLTEFGTRGMTGTASSSGATLTGTGTLFMSEVWVGCLIGNSTKGFFQVIAIASDTSLTLVSTPGSAFSSSLIYAIENPTIKVSTNTAVQVTAIASDTSLTIAANSSATVSGQTYRIGVLPTTTTYPASGNCHLNIWVGNGASGTGVFASTQRAAPFGISGYNTHVRRLGSVLLNAGSVQGFAQWGSSNDRWIQYEITRNTIGLRVLSAGTATSWTAVFCGGVVPPLVKAVNFNASVASIIGYAVYCRTRNTGDSATSRSLGVTCTSIGGTSDCFLAACDSAGYVDYVNGHASLTAYLDIVGYMETL